MFNLRAIQNHGLDAETSGGLEVGLRLRRPAVRLDLTAFHTAYEDFIESKVRLGIDPESGRMLFQSRKVAEAISTVRSSRPSLA